MWLTLLFHAGTGLQWSWRIGPPGNGGRANGAFVLNDVTVIDDGLIDNLWGGGGLVWFLFGPGDRPRDRAQSELVN